MCCCFQLEFTCWCGSFDCLNMATLSSWTILFFCSSDILDLASFWQYSFIILWIITIIIIITHKMQQYHILSALFGLFFATRVKFALLFVASIKRMLNFNQNLTKTTNSEPQWKVLIYDRCGQDIISPLLSVKELRDAGITLHQ